MASVRTQKLKQMAQAYQAAANTEREIYALLIASLEPGQLKALRYVEQCSEINGHGVAKYMGVKLNHASTLLKQLFELGLVTREEVMDEEGREYFYRAPKGRK